MCGAVAETETQRLLVARAGTECWPEGLVFPLWSLVAPNAFERRRDGPKEMFLERQSGGSVCFSRKAMLLAPAWRNTKQVSFFLPILLEAFLLITAFPLATLFKAFKMKVIQLLTA